MRVLQVDRGDNVRSEADQEGGMAGGSSPGSQLCKPGNEVRNQAAISEMGS